jgi:hypothetical protein
MAPASKNLAVCIDDSDASRRVVRYIGTMLGGSSSGFTVRLIHILEPVAPEFRESRGAETTAGEETVEGELRQKQARQMERSKQEARPILEEAKSILIEAGVLAEAVLTDSSVFFNRDDLAKELLTTARAAGCGTIVVGRESFSWIKESFQSHVSDELVQEGQGLAIWIVQ